MSKECRRCCPDTVEDVYQEEAQKQKVGKQERKTREAKKGIQKKVIDESAENKEKRTGGPDLMRSWDCSQIENEEEEESGQERNQMAAQWEEEQKLEGIMERRRMEGSSLNLDCHAKST